MKNKLLAIDIDGTLIPHVGKCISEKNRQALIKLQKAGCTLVLVSGRLRQGMEGFAKDLEMDKYNGYIITNNGAEIVSLKDRKTIYRNCLRTEDVKLLYKKSKELNTNLMIIQEENIIMTGYDEAVELDKGQLSCDFIWPHNIEKYLELDTFRCNFTKNPEVLDEVEKKLKELYKDRFEISRGIRVCLDVTEKGSDKGYALEYLAGILNVSRENVVACGDGDNDKNMIRFAGIGVAMESASEETLKVADIIAPNPEEDGMAWVVNNVLKI